MLGTMDQRLASLVDDYLASVASAVKLLQQAGIVLPRSNTEWACNELPQTGILPGGIKYFKHGYGVAVHLKSGTVDFDFGEKGEINGFDVWRLSAFAEENLGQYGFNSEEELAACFKEEVNAEALVYSGYMLHYVRDAGA